jgi:uncharacterized protein (UPF0332 family)
MAFGWEDYLSLAEALSDDADDEAALRSAVSGAYYAALHITKDSLNAGVAEVSEDTDSIHRAVWGACQRRGGDWMEVYKYGNRLRKRRGDADYDTSKQRNWFKEAEQSIIEADKVLDGLKKAMKTSGSGGN